MNGAAITFAPDGLGRCLYTEAIDLSRIGQLSISRATTIEFDNRAQYWRVKDPTGFAMFNSPSRQECLDWERHHLESQEDMKHEQFSDSAGAVAAGA
ncbi:MAG: hypothetical protein QGH15_22460 [Kiritimatiellia bacterium]|jgi:hypothetical protein|nr:hypothetical protein [Kiritimatiellia bacterium]